MLDFNTLLEQLGKLDPARIDELASQFAADPNMPPPQIGEGGLAGVLDNLGKEMTAQQMVQAPVTTSPLVNTGQTAGGPMAAGQSLSALLAGPQAGQGVNLTGGQGGGVDPRMAMAMQAIQPGQAQPAPMAPPGGLSLGAATPAQGLELRPAQASVIPGLGELLARGQR